MLLTCKFCMYVSIVRITAMLCCAVPCYGEVGQSILAFNVQLSYCLGFWKYFQKHWHNHSKTVYCSFYIFSIVLYNKGSASVCDPHLFSYIHDEYDNCAIAHSILHDSSEIESQCMPFSIFVTNRFIIYYSISFIFVSLKKLTFIY